MKKTVFRILAAFLASLSFLSLTAAASVDTTEEGAGDPGGIYVAGQPDFYPIESFEISSGSYIGAAPAFLRLVSERSGLDFSYIRASSVDRRGTLAGNQQVDVFFAASDEPGLLELGAENIPLFRVLRGGEQVQVYCVLTEVSREEERAAIRAAAESLTKDDVALLLSADNDHWVERRTFVLYMAVLGGAFLAALIAVVLLLTRFYRGKHRKAAMVDTATQIGNRPYFLHMFQSTISDATRELYYVIHYGFDIDTVNKNYGAEESDSILRYAADTVAQRVKDNEFCARVSGGAFAAAIYATDADQAESRADETLRVLNAYSGKYRNGEMRQLFHAGICALALDDKNGDKVLYNLEQAYDRAVEQKKPFAFVNHDVLDEQRARVSIREQAGDALDAHDFTPYVQFIVSARDGAICGGELLSRWENRLYGLLNPGTYVPILQDMGLIAGHDLQMLEEACKLLQEWGSKGIEWFLTCNLTRITISDPSLSDKITSIAQRYTFPRDKLILEVTEDSLEEDKDSALRNITSLKEKGFRVALDDFSSGFTSVADLYGYAVDLVKLDRKMIEDADRDQQAAALLTEITRLCHELHIHVLAEGVETERQAQQVKAALCDYIQGYYYARPLPLRELDGFGERYRPDGIDGSDEPPAKSSIGEQGPTEDVCASEERRTAAAEKPAQLYSQSEKGGQSMSHEKNRAAEQNEAPEKKQSGLQIQYGPYHLELPGDIDMDSVVGVLRAIQDGLRKAGQTDEE